MRVIGLIPARGGSKGIPRKNIRLLCGRPLLEYTAKAALAAKLLSRVVLSTDDEEIADVGRGVGLDVPFLRPKELATDQTPTLPVIQHAVEWLESHGERFDAVCLLEPTNPLRTPKTIDSCLQLLEESGSDSAITILRVPQEYNPHWVYFRSPDGVLSLSTGETSPIPRRQDLPPAFHRDGSVYATRRDVLVNQNTIYGSKCLGYEVDPAESLNIDDLSHWKLAEERLSKQII